MIPKEALDKALEAWRETPMLGDALMNALEAAAPFLRAQALEDAAKYIEDWIKAGADDPISPDETRNWLRARAVTERQP